MILFTIDTSGKNGSLGLARREGAEMQVLAEESLAGGQYSSELIPKFAAMLERCGLTKSDVDAIAVVAGPGSFTGLRVGLAAAKGLAEIFGKPLTALSALELVAASGKRDGAILAALDAGRSEVFLGHCEVSANFAVRTVAEFLVKQSELAERAREIDALLVTPDEKIASLAEAAGLSVQRILAAGPELTAHVAFAQLDRGTTVRPDDLDANYIRRSDAEIFSAPFL
jgi:tRNA threonylcarbamoyladenosine biosynthesis protein TsaB